MRSVVSSTTFATMTRQALHQDLDAAAPWLQSVLHSSDRQQRQLAAHLLREEYKHRRAASEAMLRACVEALEDDAHWLLREHEEPDRINAYLEALEDCDRVIIENMPTDESMYGMYCEIGWWNHPDRRRLDGITVPNATESVTWFLADERRIRLAGPLLAGQLDSADPQASFLASFLLARIGGGPWRNRVVPILVGSLVDNDIRGDAVLATQALAWLGSSGLPDLREWLLKGDVQSELLLRHVIAKIAGEHDPDAVHLSRDVLRDLDFYSDPLERDGYSYWRPRVPHFPAPWRAVPYRATLHLLPVSVD